MFYLKLAVESTGVLILVAFIVLELPAGAALAAMACFVWLIWLAARVLGRSSTHQQSDTTSSDSLGERRAAPPL